MIAELKRHFATLAAGQEYCTLRYVGEHSERLSVRQNVVQPPASGDDAGVMITVAAGSGLGYAATCDLSLAGLQQAVRAAREWAERAAASGLVDQRTIPRHAVQGTYRSTVRQPWDSQSLPEKIELLRATCAALKRDPRIVDWETSLWHNTAETLLLSSDGADIHQETIWLMPAMSASANSGAETQTRTLGGHGYARQGGLEILDALGFATAPERIAEQALELLGASNCPSGTMDVVLAPDQMILQVHESIGHPLELDRILGDERNYAGTSFVTPEMFGSYRYGSDLLNVAFDPTVAGELASYGFDDDGQPATKEYVIRNGILQRPLGGTTSRARTTLAGTANARASGWDRPPIDRMANLNLEPGDATLEALIGAVTHGVYMETNRSWSIDDSRNKFQFGCEYGRVIENGRLGAVLKNCNYRGISATFWRSLKGVGNAATVEVLGTPYCGKGEPNQLVRVGHAAPACLFTNVEVFGGA